jgi:hypothetical protein
MVQFSFLEKLLEQLDKKGIAKVKILPGHLM